MYRVLRELTFKGLVRRTPDAPSIYSATPLIQALTLLLERQEQKLSFLKEKTEALIRSLGAQQKEPQQDGQAGHFNLIAGGGNVLHRLIEMINESETDYVSVASKYGLRRMSGEGVLGQEFARAIKSAHRRGVRIKVISDIDRTDQRSANVLSRYLELRNLGVLSIYLDIVDKDQMLIGPPIPDDQASERSVREADLWTNNPQFTLGMYQLFERLWRAASKRWPGGR